MANRSYAAGVAMQAAADVHSIAQRLDDVVRAAYSDFGTVALGLDPEDAALLRGVEHVRADLVALHGRLVAVAKLAEATIEHAPLLEREEGAP